MSWLAGEGSTATDWNGVLDAIGNLPFDALGADAPQSAAIAAEMRPARLRPLRRSRADAAAGRGLRAAPALLVAAEIGSSLGRWPVRSRRNALRAHSPVPAPALNIQALFALLDAVREARSLAETPVNKSLVIERLLWRLTAAARVG